ncbi:MAG: hypothetical protein OXF02_02790 [Simkaniaceae bacterium]|nr:hypothetical protein [Simkaniaceae bacterium]
MVGPIAPPTVVVGQQPINVAPVVNQPVVAPVVNQPVVAPVVVANNVAQKWSRRNKLYAIAIGATVGECVVGGGCVIGAVVGVAEIATQMGASDAVIGAVGSATGCVGILCVAGSPAATAAYYFKSASK